MPDVVTISVPHHWVKRSRSNAATERCGRAPERRCRLAIRRGISYEKPAIADCINAKHAMHTLLASATRRRLPFITGPARAQYLPMPAR